MSIGAIWGEIWNEAIWDTAIWSQEAATPEPQVREITSHKGIFIDLGTDRQVIASHHSGRINTGE